MKKLLTILSNIVSSIGSIKLRNRRAALMNLIYKVGGTKRGWGDHARKPPWQPTLVTSADFLLPKSVTDYRRLNVYTPIGYEEFIFFFVLY